MNANILARNAPISQDERRPRLLKIGGIVPFSATDYPDKLAAVIFVQGCPWRCGYCHNPHLQARQAESLLHWPRVLEMLGRRVGLIDGVVFSGGEPTIDPALVDAIADVRNLGFYVGLHTACIYPKNLAEILPSLDWVGFDVKAPFDRYERITGIKDSGIQVRACVESIIASGIDHECRTTLHPALLHEDEVVELAETLACIGIRKYALQQFRWLGCADTSLAADAATYLSDAAVRQVSSLFAKFTLRRVDQ